MDWRVILAEPHWLELECDGSEKSVETVALVGAIAHWDGCVDILFDGEKDYTHICDLDAFIEQLQAIKAAALINYGPDWPD